MSLRCFVEELVQTGSPGSSGSQLVRLSEQEARHARLSRRLAVGDAVELFDGRGREAVGTVRVASRSTFEVAFDQVREQPRPTPSLTLCVAMPKGPRQDVLVEKCTELGVAALQPLITGRSVAGVSEHKLDKWRRATIEAAKQSGQCWLPELSAPAQLADCLARAGEFDLLVAAMLPREGRPVGLGDVFDRIAAARSVAAFVGPEGGWTPAEADALMHARAVPLSLGPNVLRIETAAISVAALVHACMR